MEYKYLDPAENVGLPRPLQYAGIYTEPPYKTNNRGTRDYRGEYLPPDAVAYASQYFELARLHIPTGIRPGNNTLIFNPYRFNNDPAFNDLCYAGQ
jgi:hypothetical protein